MLVTIEGKYGIKATVLAYSISKAGKRFITWEIEYPRLVLAELNTHKMLSKNSFSSRAVPFLKMLDQLNGRPVRFGANQAGMQDKGEDYNGPVVHWEYSDGEMRPVSMLPEEAWDRAKEDAVANAQGFFDSGYHKQVYNRLLEPWQMMKTVISGTETDNFFWLRNHKAADPTLHELARVMKEAQDNCEPTLLHAGEWHLPYVNVVFFTAPGDSKRTQSFYIEEHFDFVGPNNDKIYPHLTLEEAIKVSCARCAAVSYRNEGYGLAKSIEVYDRLVGDERKHASAFEHCATPIAEEKKVYEGGSWSNSLDPYGSVNVPFDPLTWEPGITHVDRQGRLWSGNLMGYIQYRKLIPGENYESEVA
jgi:hypothetical protein